MKTTAWTCSILVLIFLLRAPVDAGERQKNRARSKGAAALQSKPDGQSKKPAPTANYGKYDFSVRALDGSTIRLSEHAGKVVLVNIWAPWCGPCKLESPGFVKLYAKYHAKGFDIIGVAIQTSEPEVRSFMQKYSLPWPNAIADSVARVYGTYGLPDNFLFNKEGALVKHFVGLTREEALGPLIEEALR